MLFRSLAQYGKTRKVPVFGTVTRTYSRCGRFEVATKAGTALRSTVYRREIHTTASLGNLTGTGPDAASAVAHLARKLYLGAGAA